MRTFSLVLLSFVTLGAVRAADESRQRHTGFVTFEADSPRDAAAIRAALDRSLRRGHEGLFREEAILWRAGGQPWAFEAIPARAPDAVGFGGNTAEPIDPGLEYGFRVRPATPLPTWNRPGSITVEVDVRFRVPHDRRFQGEWAQRLIRERLILVATRELDALGREHGVTYRPANWVRVPKAILPATLGAERPGE